MFWPNIWFTLGTVNLCSWRRHILYCQCVVLHMYIFMCVCVSTHTVYPHYPWIPYLWIRLCAKIYLFWGKVNLGGTFVVICGLVPVQSDEKFESLDTWIPSWGWTSWCSAFCFSSHTVNVLFITYLVPRFFHFCAFCSRFHCLKWLSKHSLPWFGLSSSFQLQILLTYCLILSDRATPIYL